MIRTIASSRCTRSPILYTKGTSCIIWSISLLHAPLHISMMPTQRCGLFLLVLVEIECLLTHDFIKLILFTTCLLWWIHRRICIVILLRQLSVDLGSTYRLSNHRHLEWLSQRLGHLVGFIEAGGRPCYHISIAALSHLIGHRIHHLVLDKVHRTSTISGSRWALWQLIPCFIVDEWFILIWSFTEGHLLTHTLELLLDTLSRVLMVMTVAIWGESFSFGTVIVIMKDWFSLLSRLLLILIFHELAMLLLLFPCLIVLEQVHSPDPCICLRPTLIILLLWTTSICCNLRW